jgi:hypothetical protein
MRKLCQGRRHRQEDLSRLNKWFIRLQQTNRRVILVRQQAVQQESSALLLPLLRRSESNRGNPATDASSEHGAEVVQRSAEAAAPS